MPVGGMLNTFPLPAAKTTIHLPQIYLSSFKLFHLNSQAGDFPAAPALNPPQMEEGRPAARRPMSAHHFRNIRICNHILVMETHKELSMPAYRARTGVVQWSGVSGCIKGGVFPALIRPSSSSVRMACVPAHVLLLFFLETLNKSVEYSLI